MSTPGPNEQHPYWCHFCKKDVPRENAVGLRGIPVDMCPDCGSQIDPPLQPRPEKP